MNADEAKIKEQKNFYEELRNKLLNLSDTTSVIREIVHEYGSSIEQVFQKIKSVQGIANKTNLLAINASIETIHASDLLASFEQIVTKNLIIQAKIIAEILNNDPDFLCQDGVKFARECGMEEFYITDDKGIVKFTNVTAWNNAMLNSSEMLKILGNSEMEIALPATGTGLDSEQYKVVGISRVDQVGVIQIGAHFVRPKGQLAIDGFGIVAKEAKRLADVSKGISSRITGLTNDLGDKIVELENKFAAIEDGITNNLEKIDSDKNSINESEKAYSDLKKAFSEFELCLGESRKYFKDILSPLTELINIARQTNLLGVRAAIEAAHSTNDKQDFDNLLNRHMVVEAKLSALMIERMPLMTCEELTAFADYTGVDEFWITDASGVVELTNVPGGKGFVFQNEGQTAPYMRILSNPELVVTAPPSVRTLDNRVFKYVGVGRRGKNGVFQIGAISKLYGESTAEGFSVVAKQIKNLADQSKEITTEIQAKVQDMNFKAQRAIDHMKIVNRSKAEIQLQLEEMKFNK